jgi:glycosyltransferase involved in cell wall biosynthesis
VSPSRPPRILALSPFPEEGAGCRFRVSQYVPTLEAAGFEVTVRPFFSPDFFRLVYRNGQYLRKTVQFAGLAAQRLLSLTDVSRFDLILIYREAFPIGPPFIETALALRGAPIVFDFDDAIFLPNASAANRFMASLKYPRKVATIIRNSSFVIAGNEYLAEFARTYNDSVAMIPTSVDTTKFVPRCGPRPPGDPIVGWIGSPTTAPYVQSLGRAFQRVAARQRFTLRVSGTGQAVQFPGVTVANEPWSLECEVELFNTCDVGVYPLADDEWSKGKCGFKAIQFMACGVPVVASAVGVNREIVQDGVNGFLASSEDEWVEKIDALLSDPALRARFAEAGRRTVEERYSVRVNGPKLVARLRDVLRRSGRGGGES